MKRTAISLVVLVLFLCMGASTQAQDSEGDVVSMPNALCVSWGQPPPTPPPKSFDQLAIKLSGTVNTADGPVKFYEISGVHTFAWGLEGIFPITGTGYRKGDTFHYSYTGSLSVLYVAKTTMTLVAGGKLNLTTGEGTLTWHAFRYEADGSPVLSEGAGEVETYVVDCGVCPAPAPPEAGLSMPLPE